MLKRLNRYALPALIVTLPSVLLAPFHAVEPEKIPMANVEQVEMGSLFPPHTFDNLNAGIAGPERIDFAKVYGKQSIVLCYWIPRNKRAEDVLLELQEYVAGLDSSKLALFSVVAQRPGMEAEVIRERAEKIGVRVPILEDAGFRLGQQLVVQYVPQISILDIEGNLRLVNGGSLKQVLGYKFTLKNAIDRVAKTGNLGTYGYLPKYYPVTELIGQNCPDFETSSLSDGSVNKWSELQDPKKLNVLVFWSIDCPHCRSKLPEINDWYVKNAPEANLVGVVKVTSDAMETQTREFLEANDIKWLTLKDDERRIARDFMVTSTPTIMIVGPDGKVDSVFVSGVVDVAAKFDQKKKELLGNAGS